MRTIFDIKEKSCGVGFLPECDVPVCGVASTRETELSLPEVSENGLVRHYSALAKRSFGHNMGFYPLGSCTMKYNPKLNEETASLVGFRTAHPLAPGENVQGCLHAMYLLQKDLCEITGMDSVTLQPAAGAHGEYTGLSLIKAYHKSRGDLARNKVIVPDSAHGTNPASAAMLGFTVVNIPSAPDGCVDLDALSEAVGDDTAALMLTNPNTVGLFDKNILKITETVHKAGGLCYYDGANLNAVMGIARPGDMGFDVVHLNLHKSFSTPHGGGGPGSGPVGCKKALSEFLPVGEAVCEKGAYRLKDADNTIGAVRSFYGNFLVAIRALTYISVLGAKGIYDAAETAVLNANYLLSKLTPEFEAPLGSRCMHEFVLSLEKLKKETGVSALDIAKCMIDRGIHPPTMYFPLIVHEALMFEPTETESKETLDFVAGTMKEILKAAKDDPASAHNAPAKAVITRPDEVMAARNPIIKI